MAKKRGHYCFGCYRYLANEKFNGKGHRIHLCKKCKSVGKANPNDSSLFSKQSPNPYMKSLKVRLVAYTDYDGYIFFEVGGKLYVIDWEVVKDTYDYSQGVSIYRFNKNSCPPFIRATEIDRDTKNIVETLMVKCEQVYEIGLYLDNIHFELLEEEKDR